jgi:hypothetical protein
MRSDISNHIPTIQELNDVVSTIRWIANNSQKLGIDNQVLWG